MMSSWVYPGRLTAEPQLAILATLDHMLQQAAYALIAAHPELASGTGAEAYSQDDSEIWVADGLCDQIATVQHTLGRYRQLIERRRELRHRC